MTKQKIITLTEFSNALLLVAPSKHSEVLKRFSFDYGCLTFGLTANRIKKTLFHVNYIFKLGNNKTHRNPLYFYRLTNEEINKIIFICNADLKNTV